jgi:hypothetical protein
MAMEGMFRHAKPDVNYPYIVFNLIFRTALASTECFSQPGPQRQLLIFEECVRTLRATVFPIIERANIFIFDEEGKQNAYTYPELERKLLKKMRGLSWRTKNKAKRREYYLLLLEWYRLIIAGLYAKGKLEERYASMEFKPKWKGKGGHEGPPRTQKPGTRKPHHP